ncbi:hypothetical protein F7725_024111 [Dissostichus mawsoni]|uniref:Uncharacterized protein n=1 Tax=Dissostichus mawsoni TaxID=36200 RepID=A0A7J5XYJ2_DISMA|nr:hypothetical protein F7725_024111 [Dissostichus mawsoni]
MKAGLLKGQWYWLGTGPFTLHSKKENMGNHMRALRLCWKARVFAKKYVREWGYVLMSGTRSCTMTMTKDVNPNTKKTYMELTIVFHTSGSSLPDSSIAAPLPPCGAQQLLSRGAVCRTETQLLQLCLVPSLEQAEGHGEPLDVSQHGEAQRRPPQVGLSQSQQAGPVQAVLATQQLHILPETSFLQPLGHLLTAPGTHTVL